MSDKLNVRKAAEKDIPAIISIHKNCVLKTNIKFYPPTVIKEWIESISKENILNQFKNTKWVVCEKDKKIAGFVQYSLQEGTLFQIQVEPKSQGTGIGSALYRYVEEDFVRSGLEKISLNATLNAVPFYEKMGFSKLKNIQFKLKKTLVEMIKMEKIFC